EVSHATGTPSRGMHRTVRRGGLLGFVAGTAGAGLATIGSGWGQPIATAISSAVWVIAASTVGLVIPDQQAGPPGISAPCAGTVELLARGRPCARSGCSRPAEARAHLCAPSGARTR